MKNNEKKCEMIMDAYLSLDKNEIVPLKITAHLLMCRECRTAVRRLSVAERIASRTMKNGFGTSAQNENHISMTKWVIGGFAMTSLLLLFGITMRDSSPTQQIVFYLTFAAAICIYCAVFVAGNLDFFIKTIKKLPPTAILKPLR